MATRAEEIARREKAALAAIRQDFDKGTQDSGVALFVAHHLEELPGSYWEKHLGTAKPEPERVLGLLRLRSHWSDEDDGGLDTFDFTLPEDVTQYVLSVYFDAHGGVERVSMES